MKELFVKTGILNLDSFFERGGYPRGNTILLLGGPGSGKSIFGMQYLYRGACDNGEPGIYVTLDEPPAKIRRNTALFGWDLASVEGKRLILVDAVSGRTGSASSETYRATAGIDVNSITNLVQTTVSEVGAKRLVIDSISVMNLSAKSDFEMRTQLMKLSQTLSKLDVTSLVLAEARDEDMGVTTFPPEAFMFDGVISMRLDTNRQERRISIRKMRGTRHVIGSFKFNITDSGIEVTP